MTTEQTQDDYSDMPDKPAGKGRGILLLFGSCLPILGAVLLGPVLPDIAHHFAAVPKVEILAPMLMTAPALFVAITAPFMGRIADRFGRRRPLIIALIAYSIVGLAPLWLMSIYSILGSRLLLGITEAMVMTACTALIGDYYRGKTREYWFSAQAGIAALAATVFFGAGGALGGVSWRLPFVLYAAGFVMLPFVLWAIYEPSKQQKQHSVERMPAGQVRQLKLSLPLAVIAGIGLLLLPIQFGFLLEDLGIHSPEMTGLLSASNQAAVLVGAMLFPLFKRMIGFHWVFVIALLLNGFGTILGGLSGGVPGLLVSGLCAGFGSGLLLTSLINWTFDSLTASTRGRGAGGLNSCLFLGEFLSPLLISGLAYNYASLTVGLGIGGVVIMLCAIPAFGFALKLRRNNEPLAVGS